MTAWDKLWTVLLNALLIAAGTFVLIAWAASYGCAKAPHTAASEPEEPLRVVIFNTVPNSAWFCLEDANVNGFLEEPQVKFGRISCPVTVGELRRQVARLRVAD